MNTGLRQQNEYVFHALAIDEHRKAFGPTLWTNQGATTVAPRAIERTEQRWFVGAHANVGGGCLNDPLAQIPFEWLKRKAAALGLTFNSEFEVEAGAASAEISDSFSEMASGLYRLLRLGIRFHRLIGIPPAHEGPGVKNINETIDASVFDRWRADDRYRPRGLRNWANRNGLDPATVTTSVRADAPTVIAAN